MMSVSKVSSAGAGVSYYQGDNYYAKDDINGEGRWVGQAAKEIGFEGKAVAPEDFKKFLEGKMPNGQQLGRMVKGELQRVPAWDATLSAPKSLSVATEVFGIRGLAEMHTHNVSRTLAIFEKEMLVTRKYDTKARNQKAIGDQKMLAASFTHDVSRNMEPQLHTHNVIINGVLDDGGKWRCIESRASLYQNKMLLGLIYRAGLAADAREAGHDTFKYRKDGKVYFGLHSVPSAINKHFSSRSEQIKHHLGEGQHTAQQKADAALKTRSNKVQADRSELQGSWLKQIENLGFASENIRSILENAVPLSKEQVTKEIAEKQPEALRSAINSLGERVAAFDHKSLYMEAMQFGMGHLRYEDVKSEVQNAIQDERLICKSDDGLLTTNLFQQRERDTLDFEKSGRGTRNPISSRARIERLIERNSFTAGQSEAASMILSSTDSIVAVQGYAGTGKSYMLNAVVNEAKARRYKPLAMSGSSSVVKDLKSDLGIPARTLQSFLLKPSGNSRTVIVLDEASMVSTLQMKALLEIVKEKKIAKLVLVGDTRQLDAVGAGRPFQALQENGIRTAEMKEVIRQSKQADRDIVIAAADGDYTKAITKLADRVVSVDREEMLDTAVKAWMKSENRDATGVVVNTNREAKYVNSQIQSALSEDHTKDTKEIKITSYRSMGLTTEQLKHHSNFYDAQAVKFHRDYKGLQVKAGDICEIKNIDMRRGEIHLSSGDRDFIFRTGRDAPGSGSVDALKATELTLREGDEIRFTDNLKSLQVANKDRGKVLAVTPDSLKIRLRDGRDIDIKSTDAAANSLTHGWAQTNHAFQGKTLDSVIVIMAANAR